MPIEWKKTAAASAFALSLLGTPLLAQDMGEWDADADGDGLLTEDEFNAGVYNGYDADDSGGIEEPEFGDGGDDIGDGGLFDI
jgi:hypothetical protein